MRRSCGVQAMGSGSLRAARSPWAWTLCGLLQLACQDFKAVVGLADKAVQCLGTAGYEPFDLVRKLPLVCEHPGQQLCTQKACWGWPCELLSG